MHYFIVSDSRYRCVCVWWHQVTVCVCVRGAYKLRLLYLCVTCMSLTLCVMVCESMSIVWQVYVSVCMLDCLCLSVISRQGDCPLAVYMAPSGIVSSVYMQQ